MAVRQPSRSRLQALLKMDFVSTFGALVPSSILIWKALAILFLITNIKNLPFVWHYRVFRAFYARLYFSKPKRPLDPSCLFLPAISRTHAPLLETDFNLHKSNSTYLTDVDICRANTAVLFLGDHVATSPWSPKPKLMLGGVQIVWRKEIKPYVGYDVWTRVLTWDDKWIYPICHFVEKDAFKPALYLQNLKLSRKDVDNMAAESLDQAKELRETHARKVYATAISRVVIKDGRVPVKPEELLRRAGLLPTDPAELAKVEERRLRYLKLAQGEGAWDGLHATFFDSTGIALGRYTDTLTR